MRRFVVASACLVAALVSCLQAFQASAASRPTVRFHFKHSSITDGTRPVIAVTVRHAARATAMKVQRQQGTSHVWTTIKKAKVGSNTLTLPAAHMGASEYRVLLVRRHVTLARSRAHVLRVYGTISLDAFCNSFDTGWECPHGTHSVNGKLWSYVDRVYSVNEWVGAFKSKKGTSCRSIAVSWVMQGSTSRTGYLRLQQTKTDEQDANGPGSTVNSVHLKLDGGPLVFQVKDPVDGYFYLNGSASCYTADGKM